MNIILRITGLIFKIANLFTIAWVLALFVVCQANMNIVALRIPFTNNEIYAPLCAFILLSYPAINITKLMLKIGGKRVVINNKKQNDKQR
jgi:hypothetical protein